MAINIRYVLTSYVVGIIRRLSMWLVMDMKKLLIIVGVLVVGVIFAIRFFWDWVIVNPELTAGFLTAFLLLLAFIAALLNLRQMRHDRTMSLATSLRQTYDSGEIFEARILVQEILNEQENQVAPSQKEKHEYFLSVLEDYSKNKPREFTQLTSIPALFDLIGWLVREHCCELKAIDEQLDCGAVYEQWELYIRKKQGKKNGEPLDESPTATYGNFVWLVNRVSKLSN